MVSRGEAPVWDDYKELLRLREKLMQLEEMLRQAGDSDLLRKRLREEQQKNRMLIEQVGDLTDERDAFDGRLKKAEATIGRRDIRIIELEAQLIALDEAWTKRLENAVDSVKLCVIAPRLTVSFEGGTKVKGVPTIPREQLNAMLNDDLLPRFARIFSDRTTENSDEDELLQMASPESQSVWLRERMETLKTSVTEQIEGLFGNPGGLEVLGQRRAAAALARSSS